MDGSRLARPQDKPGKRPGRHDQVPWVSSSPAIPMTSFDRIHHVLYQYICELYVLGYIVQERIMNLCLQVGSSSSFGLLRINIVNSTRRRSKYITLLEPCVSWKQSLLQRINSDGSFVITVSQRSYSIHMRRVSNLEKPYCIIPHAPDLPGLYRNPR
jgi:hypothetical protein